MKTDTCWLWMRGLNSYGYGTIKHHGRNCQTHRVAWELANGPIPAGMMVCHKCDVRHCVNPEHLFLGTAFANKADCVAKGRHAYGELDGNVKLSTSKVRRIKALYQTGLISKVQLAKAFGVSDATIGHVVNGKTWVHVK